MMRVGFLNASKSGGPLQLMSLSFLTWINAAVVPPLGLFLTSVLRRGGWGGGWVASAAQQSGS